MTDERLDEIRRMYHLPGLTEAMAGELLKHVADLRRQLAEAQRELDDAHRAGMLEAARMVRERRLFPGAMCDQIADAIEAVANKERG